VSRHTVSTPCFSASPRARCCKTLKHDRRASRQF
jgi:hypothetical protein